MLVLFTTTTMASQPKAVSFLFYSTEELMRVSSIQVNDKSDISSPALGTGASVYCSICSDPKRCPGHMGFIQLKEPIFNPLCLKEIIRTAEMMCPKCGSFDSIEKIKGRKICSTCKDHARTYTFDPKRMCLVDKKEPSYTIPSSVVKKMFSTLSPNQINAMDYELSNPKDFIMDIIPVVPNCIRLSSGPDDSLARLYGSILVNANNPAVVYRDYCTIVGKESVVNNEESLVNRISGKEGTFRKYALGKRNKHCARAVITPDPNIDVDEVGIPLSFCSNIKVQKDGDYVLLNRQPSLQRMSLMAFRARIMPDSYTIRINPSACPAFNADFDGDEMNIFCVSSYSSKVECDTLLAVNKCILSPQNSMPIIYAIQDTVTGSFMMYNMNKVLKRSTLHDCIMMSCVHLDNNNIRTSRDLISMFIQTLSSNIGIIIKSITSDTIRSIVKSIFINSGGDRTLMFLGSLQRIVNRWILEEGLSVGYDDCINRVGSVTMPNINTNNKDIGIVLNNIRNISQRAVIESTNDDNPLFTMIESGSKGSFVNLGQISSLVGQQWIRGKRPAKVLPGRRTLAWCSPYDDSFEAQGFVSSSYSQGLSPVEYFFHCQGGREGLVNTGVNTSDAGYIQRRISKSMQDVVTQYDGTVRDGTNIVQFCYGQDNSDNSRI